MSRYIAIAHDTPGAPVIGAVLASAGKSTGPRISQRGVAFIVKLRNPGTRSWGNQTEVLALTAKDAAEDVSGERLIQGGVDRAQLRARVWAAPYGSAPDLMFYTDPRDALAQ
ncbi:hypothetical protein [Enterovirga sp.]|uniref:hypothetical protein n=1 Tax=Enterovirga sp. TaxID=2026350 RepID=UPI002627A064|nr:hypothetical protein [Enterovirga sp.]MDB5590901.1 hypothetical protein [Enterovirga sp.]